MLVSTVGCFEHGLFVSPRSDIVIGDQPLHFSLEVLPELQCEAIYSLAWTGCGLVWVFSL